MQSAHAVPAARGEWVTNEERLLEQAGSRDIDAIAEPEVLRRAITEAEAFLQATT